LPPGGRVGTGVAGTRARGFRTGFKWSGNQVAVKGEVVAEVCELAYDPKTPLLKVLSEIAHQLPA